MDTPAAQLLSRVEVLLVRATLLLALAATATAGLVADAAAQANRKVIAISSYDAPPYRQAVAGIQRVMAAGGHGNALERASMEESERAAERAVKIGGKDAMVVALGAKALEFVLAKKEIRTKLACLVLNTGGLAGVTLRHSPEARFERLLSILPDAKTVGVLYGRAEDRAFVDYFINAGRKMGLQFIPHLAGDENDPRQIAPWSANAIDVVMPMYDTRLTSPQIAQHLIEFSFRNRIPLVGLSDAWTKAGALFSLDWDFGDIGQQCGQLALDVLRGVDTAAIGVVRPRKLVYSVNLRTANQFRLTLAGAELKSARQIFD